MLCATHLQLLKLKMSFNEPKGPWDNERFNCKFFEILLQQFGENFELPEISDIC